MLLFIGNKSAISNLQIPPTCLQKIPAFQNLGYHVSIKAGNVAISAMIVEK